MEEARLELENAQRATTALRHARPIPHVTLARYAVMNLHAVSAGLQAMSGTCYLQWHILPVVEEACMEPEKANLGATALWRVQYPHEARRISGFLCTCVQCQGRPSSRLSSRTFERTLSWYTPIMDFRLTGPSYMHPHVLSWWCSHMAPHATLALEAFMCGSLRAAWAPPSRTIRANSTRCGAWRLTPAAASRHVHGKNGRYVITACCVLIAAGLLHCCHLDVAYYTSLWPEA